MRVKTDFYCTQEKRQYKRGQKYEGKRTDINHLLDVEVKEDKKHPKTRKRKIEKK